MVNVVNGYIELLEAFHEKIIEFVGWGYGMISEQLGLSDSPCPAAMTEA